MAPRMSTVGATLTDAISLMEKENYKKALNKLVKLSAKLDNAKRSPKKPPNGYALFVKANYKKYAAENPNADPIKIMSMIASAWRAQKK